MPLVAVFSGPAIGSRILGWGKPVQISLSPRSITRKISIRTAHALVAIAGPTMNILFALLLSGVFLALVKFDQQSLAVGVANVIAMNIGLCLFNLLPVPPLDGGAVLACVRAAPLRPPPRRAQPLRLHHPVRAAHDRPLVADHVAGDDHQRVLARAPVALGHRMSETDETGPSDGVGSQIDYKVELPEFEGPLDLLLHLVKKHELDILDIPIAFITDRYLSMLDVMRSLDLDIAGEYLLMAATLAHLKSRELVPPDPAEEAALADEEDDEGLDPRQELIRRLLEYQKFKDAGDKLAGRPVTGRNVWPRGASAEDVAGLHALPGGAPLAEVPVFRLIESLERVLSRAKVTFTHDVITDRISITDRINELVDWLEREGSFSFESCFDFVEAPMQTATAVKGQVVVTFLAILEMTRLKMVRLTQADVGSSIYITKAGADLKVQVEALRERPEEYKE